MKVRIHAMLRNDSTLLENWFAKGPVIDTVDHLLNVRSVKLVIDGALGNRGAWLLEDYTDKAGWRGLETTPTAHVKEISEKCLINGFQLCIHAIGDRGNKVVLDKYEEAFNKFPDKTINHRFRIEHAQHLGLDDIPRFAKLDVIAAMQSIHMSSDRPWAIDRLGERRIKEGAYVWQKLLKSGVVIINGTDVPVASGVIPKLKSFEKTTLELTCGELFKKGDSYDMKVVIHSDGHNVETLLWE